MGKRRLDFPIQGLGIMPEPADTPTRTHSDEALFIALKEMWGDQLMNCCCGLPCSDPICREDCAAEGGCKGADFADMLAERLKVI